MIASLIFVFFNGMGKAIGQKLIDAMPATIGQAGRIEGVTPAALAVLIAYLKKGRIAAKADLAS